MTSAPDEFMRKLEIETRAEYLAEQIATMATEERPDAPEQDDLDRRLLAESVKLPFLKVSKAGVFADVEKGYWKRRRDAVEAALTPATMSESDKLVLAELSRFRSELKRLDAPGLQRRGAMKWAFRARFAMVWPEVLRAWKKERALLPRGIKSALISVDRHAIRAMEGLAGAHPKRIRPEGSSLERRPGADSPTVLVFTWDNGIQTQLELQLDEPGGALEEVGRRYGEAAVRDVMSLFFFAWGNGARADSFWWWPDEHLELNNIARSKENLSTLNARMTRLHKTRLEAHYENGSPLIGPLVAANLTDGTARRLTLHPAIYAGVRRPTGELGNYFWSVPLEVLRVPVGGPQGGRVRVHGLAFTAGDLFRANQGGPAKISSRRLMHRLGIGKNDGRERNTRGAETLQRTLDSGKAAGLLDGYDVEGGDLANPRSVVCLRPGNEARQLWTGADTLRRPARIPGTGAELVGWLNDAGMTATDAAELMGVEARSFQRGASYGERPLPPKLRAALRHHLWPNLTS